MNQSIVVPETGKSLQVMSDIVTILVSGAETDNKYAVMESTTFPKGGVPLLHTHPHQETFHILEGEYEIYGRDADGNKVATPAPAGSVIHIPGGTPHGFLNVGETPGKMLMTVEPASMVDFFKDLGTPIEDPSHPPQPAGPPDMEALLSICAKHNIHFVEAPPA